MYLASFKVLRIAILAEMCAPPDIKRERWHDSSLLALKGGRDVHAPKAHGAGCQQTTMGQPKSRARPTLPAH